MPECCQIYKDNRTINLYKKNEREFKVIDSFETWTWRNQNDRKKNPLNIGVANEQNKNPQEVMSHRQREGRRDKGSDELCLAPEARGVGPEAWGGEGRGCGEGRRERI